ncbi:hypothetical protein MPTK1_3g21445 [Marchantia polymorpha subsp. ruderalis]
MRDRAVLLSKEPRLWSMAPQAPVLYCNGYPMFTNTL